MRVSEAKTKLCPLKNIEYCLARGCMWWVDWETIQPETDPAGRCVMVNTSINLRMIEDDMG